MPSVVHNILLEKLIEIQSSLPPFVKLIKEEPSNFDEVLKDTMNFKNSKHEYYADNNFSFADGRYDEIINNMARKYNISPVVIKSVIKAESGFSPHAVSKVGAMGLMQLMPDTAKLLGVKDPYDPIQNIEGGVRYLRQMLNEFGGNLELALAAYNAGPGNVKKYGGIPPFEETQNYVKKIFNYMKNNY